MKKGFTLVELAIVIVIIGLLVSGVLAGGELIKQAKVRNQIKKFEGYNAAVLMFKSKYGFLPGDMPGAQCSQLGFATNTSSTVPPNGDGLIGDDLGRVPPLGGWPEPKYFFSQLWQAKLISDTISVVASSSNIGESFPFSAIGDGGFMAASLADGGLYWFLGPSRKTDGQTSIQTNSDTPFISPEMAYALDDKIDDDIPNTGKVRAVIVTSVVSTQFSNDTSTACVSNSGAGYNFANNTNICRLIVRSVY